MEFYVEEPGVGEKRSRYNYDRMFNSYVCKDRRKAVQNTMESKDTKRRSLWKGNT